MSTQKWLFCPSHKQVKDTHVDFTVNHESEGVVSRV